MTSPLHLLFIIMMFYLTGSLAACRLEEAARPINEDYDDGINGKGPALTVIGDSLSTGVIASSQMGHDLPRGIVASYSKFLFGRDRSLEATQAMFSEYRHSAMTSDEDWGMRGLIAKKHGLAVRDIPIFFSAQWGGRLMHVAKYLTNLRTLYKDRGRTADYLLVMIGGNDYCRDYTVDKFASNYDHALREILALHPQATVMIGFVPPIYQTLRQTHNYTATLSCTQFRKWFCAPMLAQDSYSRYVGFNNAIEAAAKKYSKIHQGDIHLVTGVREILLDRPDIAYDCFHPSLNGHKKFAQQFANSFSRL